MISGGQHLLIYETKPAGLAVGHLAYPFALERIRKGERVAVIVDDPHDDFVVQGQFFDLAGALDIKLDDKLKIISPPRAPVRQRAHSHDYAPEPFDEIAEYIALIGDATMVLRDLSRNASFDISACRWTNETAKELAQAIKVPVVTTARIWPYQIVNRDCADIVLFLRPAQNENSCFLETQRPSTDAEAMKLHMRNVGRAVLFEGINT